MEICREKTDKYLLKNEKTRKRFEEKVVELVDVGMPILLGYFKDVVLSV